jgi:hypothetical protein
MRDSNHQNFYPSTEQNPSLLLSIQQIQYYDETPGNADEQQANIDSTLESSTGTWSAPNESTKSIKIKGFSLSIDDGQPQPTTLDGKDEILSDDTSVGPERMPSVSTRCIITCPDEHENWIRFKTRTDKTSDDQAIATEAEIFCQTLVCLLTPKDASLLQQFGIALQSGLHTAEEFRDAIHHRSMEGSIYHSTHLKQSEMEFDRNHSRHSPPTTSPQFPSAVTTRRVSWDRPTDSHSPLAFSHEFEYFSESSRVHRRDSVPSTSQTNRRTGDMATTSTSASSEKRIKIHLQQFDLFIIQHTQDLQSRKLAHHDFFVTLFHGVGVHGGDLNENFGAWIGVDHGKLSFCNTIAMYELSRNGICDSTAQIGSCHIVEWLSANSSK